MAEEKKAKKTGAKKAPTKKTPTKKTTAKNIAKKNSPTKSRAMSNEELKDASNTNNASVDNKTTTGPENAISSSSKDERNWAMATHLSTLLGWFVLPLANILAPLIIWQVKKDDMLYASEQAKECLNFQISMTVYALIAAMLCLILIGFLILPLLYVFNVVFTIIAAVKSSKGENYRYPLTFRLVN